MASTWLIEGVWQAAPADRVFAGRAESQSVLVPSPAAAARVARLVGPAQLVPLLAYFAHVAQLVVAGVAREVGRRG
jgi:hypothetical protein